MAKVEEHMNDCEKLLGDPWKRVHKFLDQYAEMFPVEIFTEYHRSFLHNKYGVETVKAIWGPEAGMAAMIHITRDYAETPIKTWKLLSRHLPKASMYFNKLENFEPHMQPHIIEAWNGESLVSIALREEKE